MFDSDEVPLLGLEDIEFESLVWGFVGVRLECTVVEGISDHVGLEADSRESGLDEK